MGIDGKGGWMGREGRQEGRVDTEEKRHSVEGRVDGRMKGTVIIPLHYA